MKTHKNVAIVKLERIFCYFLGSGPYNDQLRNSIPFFDRMISTTPYGQSRPSIAEYPAIAQHIREAIDEVSHHSKDPNQGLQEAAAKSAKTLGW